MVVLVQLVRRAVRRHVEDANSRYRISKVVVMAGYLAVVIALVSGLSGRLTGLTVALGAASAGIAFALQEVIASFAGWLAVAFGNFYKVGDRVQLGGIKGDVIDIGFLRTTLMECGAWVDGDLYSGRMVRVANSFVFKEPVFNYSGEFPFLWDEIVVPIQYGSDLALAQAVLERAANEVTLEFAEGAKKRWAELVRSYRIEDATLEPMVTLVATDNWVAFTVRYAVAPRARRLTKDALFRRILAAMDESGGRVAIASTTLELVGSVSSPSARGVRGP